MATLRSKVGHLTGLEQVHLLAIAANSPLGAVIHNVAQNATQSTGQIIPFLHIRCDSENANILISCQMAQFYTNRCRIPMAVNPKILREISV